jgi:hypothetical protein
MMMSVCVQYAPFSGQNGGWPISAFVHFLRRSYIQLCFHSKWVTLILQFGMDFVKSEPNFNSETCLTSSDSDHQMISIKEDKDSAVTLPVKMVDDVVSDVCLFVRKFYISALTF